MATTAERLDALRERVERIKEAMLEDEKRLLNGELPPGVEARLRATKAEVLDIEAELNAV